jgi:putative transcriptional regulator
MDAFASSPQDGPPSMSKMTTTSKIAEPIKPLRPMSDAEVMAAALADPDAQPLTTEDFKRMRRIPRAKIIRRALSLTQEEFSARFGIPLGTLRDWEQGFAEPDSCARAPHGDRAEPAGRSRRIAPGVSGTTTHNCVRESHHLPARSSPPSQARHFAGSSCTMLGRSQSACAGSPQCASPAAPIFRGGSCSRNCRSRLAGSDQTTSG